MASARSLIRVSLLLLLHRLKLLFLKREGFFLDFHFLKLVLAHLLREFYAVGGVLVVVHGFFDVSIEGTSMSIPLGQVGMEFFI